MLTLRGITTNRPGSLACKSGGAGNFHTYATIVRWNASCSGASVATSGHRRGRDAGVSQRAVNGEVSSWRNATTSCHRRHIRHGRHLHVLQLLCFLFSVFVLSLSRPLSLSLSPSLRLSLSLFPLSLPPSLSLSLVLPLSLSPSLSPSLSLPLSLPLSLSLLSLSTSLSPSLSLSPSPLSLPPLSVFPLLFIL